MMIRVMYSDGRFDMVKSGMLDNLINQQKVSSFKRSTGWTVVGRDQIRSSNRSNYRGRERRLL
ncbi:MAG: GSU3473 family protein [Desulfuromonadales bacterium]